MTTAAASDGPSRKYNLGLVLFLRLALVRIVRSFGALTQQLQLGNALNKTIRRLMATCNEEY